MIRIRRFKLSEEDQLPHYARIFALLPVLSTFLWACQGNTGADQPQIVFDTLTIEYADADTLFPHMRFADGLVSLNDRCAVRQTKLNRRLPPIYVNGRPIGFC